MGRLDNKVAFITGAARGQGRSHAIRLASEGADILAVDICAPVESNVAAPATRADLDETARMVEALDRRIITGEVDVRDLAAMTEFVRDGAAELGRLDIVCANAGTWSYGLAHELTESEWRETIDIVLTGVWNTCKATIPILIEQGEGGSIIVTSSMAGIKPPPNLAHYNAAKFGVIGLMKTMAVELAPHSIRVNTVNPGTVDTALIDNKPTFDLFAPDLESPTKEQVAERFAMLTAMPVPWVEAHDVSSAVLFLASEDARYITGITLPVDAGALLK